MKFLVISPKNGSVRISRFAAVDCSSPKNTEVDDESAGQALCCELERRSTAPLELSAALRARLPRQRSLLLVERQN